MRFGILGAVMFAALLVSVIVVIELVRVPHMYAVEGRGEIKYTPDEAKITASIYVESNVSADAAREAAATMRDILGALKTLGVPTDDIKTAGLRSGLLELSENERRAPDARRAYYAEQVVDIAVHDVGMIGKVLDAIAGAGSNHWVVTYTVSDRDRLERAARKAALQDAIAVADAYARDGQFTRGRILKIQDDQVQFPEVDYMSRDYRARERSGGVWNLYAPRSSALARGATATIDTMFDVPPPQEQTVTATTHVLFEID